MPLFLLGAVLGGGGIWYASKAGDKIVTAALVIGGGYLAWKYWK